MTTIRIASLLPSATEMICALGLEESLVGVSHSCDYPPSVRELPVLTESIVDPKLPSAEIDRLTKEALARGESLYRLNTDLLYDLKPDLVVTQALCDVCAISFASVARAAAKLKGTKLVSLEPGCIEDIFTDLMRLGDAVGHGNRASTLIGDGRTRLARLQEQVRDLKRPRVLTLEWFDPPFFGGHWVPQQVTCGGGISLLGQPHERSEGVAWETVLQSDPDIIFCMPCGYDVQQSRALADRELRGFEPWEALRAVQQRKAYCLDANAFFSRPSLRVVTGAELIGHLLHPSRVPQPQGTDEAHFKLD